MTKDFPKKEQSEQEEYINNLILDVAKNQVILEYIIEQLGQEEFEKRLDTAFKTILADYQKHRAEIDKE